MCSTSMQWKSRGDLITCASGWGCPPTSRAMPSTTCLPAIARPGSIHWAPSGAMTSRWAAPAFIKSEFYQPLDERQYFFVAPRVELERRPVYVYSGDQRLAQYDFRSRRAELDVGSQFTRYGQLRAGLMTGATDTSVDTGLNFLAPRRPEVSQGAYTGRLPARPSSTAQFSRARGYAAVANVYGSRGSLGADDTYTKYDISGSSVFSVGDHSVDFAFKAGDKLGDAPLPAYDQFQWGRFHAAIGLTAPCALIGQSLAFGRARLYYQKLARQDLLEGLYAGFSLEAGRVGGPLVPTNPTGLLKSGSLFVAADTFLGPVYLGYGYAAGGSRSFYLYLGRP